MISICYGNSKLCHGRGSSIDFLAGALYAGSLIPMTSPLASESCLSNLQNSATLSRASERACFSLRAASYLGLKKNFHPRKGNPGRYDEPKPEVADLRIKLPILQRGLPRGLSPMHVRGGKGESLKIPQSSLDFPTEGPLEPQTAPLP